MLFERYVSFRCGGQRNKFKVRLSVLVHYEMSNTSTVYILATLMLDRMYTGKIVAMSMRA